MSSVFESCEQQFAQITAEVSSRIIRVPSLLGGKMLRNLVQWVAKLLRIYPRMNTLTVVSAMV